MTRNIYLQRLYGSGNIMENVVGTHISGKTVCPPGEKQCAVDMLPNDGKYIASNDRRVDST